MQIKPSHMPIGDVSGLRRPDGIGPAPAQDSENGFLAALESALGEADATAKHADDLAEKFAVGDDVPVHELMTAIARSDLSLRLTTVATTRAIAAYQEIARIQV